MDTYSWMRELADSWVLLAMFVFFLGVVVWAFRPGSRQDHEESANLIFRNEKTPAGEGLEEAKQ
ncbi:cbb3-type cytochrome c oxidase subunit 3 [Vannielia litorea]|uniref:cbb3-type cytochrome c oxidase subunit 3 n=1 Tax=Vannielia litorea TaxID=1217970 RepID=UPI001C9413BB|nr:cbb3-type cytochrome c oxidase subunit 3 [Vannielia litorea]MBY6049113.1 cbb3-type cytochrome c oxidase subunit 3 [Vannielia litorea]MBY6076527.1 cbb3-type cytochrome c oxidase subunit 3 [Vannielia litorea]